MKRLIEIGLNMLFWVICFYLIFSITSPQMREVEVINDIETITISYDDRSIIGTTISFILIMLLYYFNVYFLSKYFHSKKFRSYSLYLLIATITALVLDLIKNKLIYGFEFYIFETLIVSIWLYIFFVGISFVHIMLLRWQKEEALKQKLKEDKLTAELKLLKSQINPHFLFNALNNLLSISEKHQQKEVSSGITQLSELLRFLLHDTQDNLIPLEKEVEFIENYIQLNKLRFDDEDPISITFKTIGNLKGINIAPALFIPFVENAFKHGIDIYSKSYIHITINVTKESVLFECANSMKRKNTNEVINFKNSGIGLKNVKRRLAILYENLHDLDLQEKDDTFRVKLKLIRDNA